MDKIILNYDLRAYHAYGVGVVFDFFDRRRLLTFDTWTTNKFGSYRQQFKVNCPNGNSWWVGVGLNGPRNEDRYGAARLEFNPNKVGSDYYLIEAVNALQAASISNTLKRWDMAVDFAIERSALELVKDGRTYEEIRHSAANRTQYLGARNAAGRCKLYNKALEQNLATPLSRIEVTFDGSVSAQEAAQSWPLVYNIKANSQLELNACTLSDTDRFILRILLNEPERMAELGRKKREKLAPFLIAITEPIKFDDRAFKACSANAHSWTAPQIQRGERY